MAQKKTKQQTVPGSIPATPASKRVRKTIAVIGEEVDLSQVEDLQPLGSARSPYDREIQWLQAHAGQRGRSYAAEVMPGLKNRAQKLRVDLKIGWAGGGRQKFVAWVEAEAEKPNDPGDTGIRIAGPEAA